MDQHAILEVSSPESINIKSAPPQSINRFLNERNATVIQADFSLTYEGHNLYLLMLFFQDLLQGHILVISDIDAPTGLSPLLTPP